MKNPGHKASPLFQLTDQGREVLGAINDDASGVHKRILAKFFLYDLRELRRLLRALATVTHTHHDV